MMKGAVKGACGIIALGAEMRNPFTTVASGIKE